MERLTTTLAILTVLLGCLINVSEFKTDPVPKSSPVLNVECNFGAGSYPTKNSFRTNSTSATITGETRQCKISYNVSYAIVRVSLDGFRVDLYVSAFGLNSLNGGRFILEKSADDLRRRKRVYCFNNCPNF